MQVASESPPLLLAADYQPFAGTLQISCEAHGVRCDPHLAGEVLKQLLVGSRELLAQRPMLSDKPTHRLSSIGERQDEGYVRRLLAIRGLLDERSVLLKLDRDVGQLERLRDRFGDGR